MSKMDLVAHIEGMLQSLYAFFLHNLNRFLGFFNLAKTLETKGLKLLHNIKIYWISIFNFLKQVLVEYNVLMVKMHPKASPHKITWIFCVT
jgi:hypothetical protein